MNFFVAEKCELMFLSFQEQAQFRAGVAELVLENGHVREVYCFIVHFQGYLPCVMHDA